MLGQKYLIPNAKSMNRQDLVTLMIQILDGVVLNKYKPKNDEDYKISVRQVLE